MTGPAPTNDEILAAAAGIDIEGDEMSVVVDATVAFVQAGSAALADALAQLADAKAGAFPADARATLVSTLTSAKGKFDNAEAVLTALTTPPTP